MNLNRLFALTLDRLIFRKTNAGQFRAAEHSHGHKLVIDAAVKTSEQTISQGASLINGHGREVDPISDITNGIDLRHRCDLVVVNHNPTLLHLHTSGVEAQVIKPWMTTGGQQNTTTGDTIPTIEHRSELAGLTFNRCDLLFKANGDSGFPHAIEHRIGEFRIKAPQQTGATHNLRHLNSKPSQNAGEFASDESSTNHHNG